MKAVRGPCQDKGSILHVMKSQYSSAKLGGRPRILQIFSRYRELGGEEGRVYLIGDALHRDFDVGYLLASSAEAFSGGILRTGVSALKACSNWTIAKQLRNYQALGNYQFWLIHNVFPTMSPEVYRLAFELGVPVVQYLHNYRMGCVNGFFLNHGEPCQRCMHGNFMPAFKTACWHGSRLKSGLMGAITAHARGMDLFHRIHHWVAISESQKAEHVLMGIPDEKITVIPHFLESKETIPPYPEQGDVLFAGRLSPEKGVDRLLHAWNLLGDCGRTLWIVGDGPERGRLETMSRDLALRNVRFTGFLKHAEMPEIWERAACSIVPSVWKEPFGMVVLEAWSKGRPVIAHRIGALPEIISHGSDGLLVSPGHPAELADAIRSLLLKPEPGRSMGLAGLQKLKEKHSKLTWQDAINPIFRIHDPSRQDLPIMNPS